MFHVLVNSEQLQELRQHRQVQDSSSSSDINSFRAMALIFMIGFSLSRLNSAGKQTAVDDRLKVSRQAVQRLQRDLKH